MLVNLNNNKNDIFINKNNGNNCNKTWNLYSNNKNDNDNL